MKGLMNMNMVDIFHTRVWKQKIEIVLRKGEGGKRGMMEGDKSKIYCRYIM
jgi:hypothetical protein